MGEIQSEYSAYLKQVNSLKKEMLDRGVFCVNPRFYDKGFFVYSDGNAQVQTRKQPLSTRLGLTREKLETIGLESVGQLLYHLSDSGYHKIPRSIDEITLADIRELRRALHSTDELCIKAHKKIK